MRLMNETIYRISRSNSSDSKRRHTIKKYSLYAVIYHTYIHKSCMYVTMSDIVQWINTRTNHKTQLGGLGNDDNTLLLTSNKDIVEEV